MTTMTESIATDELEQLYVQMETIRAFDTQIVELFNEGLIRGSAHPYVGMEAIAVGACSVLTDEDYITSTHRGHGHCIARGLDPKLMMAEAIGREAGYCRGRGGSMHITDVDHGMLGADGIVGGGHGIAVGAAYGARLLGKNSVILCFFGDGAANEGSFHEACNLAAVLDAPVVFICENNEWALTTRVSNTMRIANIADRAAGYGFPGVVVDGNDLFAVRAAARTAVDRARSGQGPTLIEAKTHRMTSHSAFATGRTSTDEELAEWRKKDPIDHVVRALEQLGTLDVRIAELRERAVRIVDEATEFARAAEPPSADGAREGVYAPAAWNADGRLA
jgi:acetoin:2,6-dichlorophenolindophenol oxidoreductase subunit alpha